VIRTNPSLISSFVPLFLTVLKCTGRVLLDRVFTIYLTVEPAFITAMLVTVFPVVNVSAVLMISFVIISLPVI